MFDISIFAMTYISIKNIEIDNDKIYQLLIYK